MFGYKVSVIGFEGKKRDQGFLSGIPRGNSEEIFDIQICPCVNNNQCSKISGKYISDANLYPVVTTLHKKVK